jgi:hypothetical protein
MAVCCSTFILFRPVLLESRIYLTERGEHAFRGDMKFARSLLRLRNLMMSRFRRFQFSNGSTQRSACRMKAANVPHLFGGKSTELGGEVE